MKKLLWFVVAIIVIFYFLSRDYSNSEASASSAAEAGPDAGNHEALVLIRTDEESKVFEAFISDADVLYVSVADDGTRRDGYASYLCEILREKKAKANRVKVMKVNSINDPDRHNAYGVLLGESWCN